MSVGEVHHEHLPPGHLKRTVGFYGLMFVSLGSIIGSGWLLGALNAAEAAGPASIISWIIAGIMLTVLALIYAELGGAYPVAGGTGRFPYFSHGPLAGFTAGWTSWLQAVAIAPIEVLAAITYVNSINKVNENFPMLYTTGAKQGLLNGRGLVVAVILMLIFTAMNLAGAKFMSESNALVVIWKTAVPVLAIVVVASLSFHTGNFTASCGRRLRLTRLRAGRAAGRRGQEPEA
jgi:amino acid transporter